MIFHGQVFPHFAPGSRGDLPGNNLVKPKPAVAHRSGNAYERAARDDSCHHPKPFFLRAVRNYTLFSFFLKRCYFFHHNFAIIVKNSTTSFMPNFELPHARSTNLTGTSKLGIKDVVEFFTIMAK